MGYCVPRHVVEGQQVPWAIRFVERGMTKHIFECALQHQQTLAAVVGENRDPSPLKIKLNLVDLSPVPDVHLGVAEDGLVERVPEPTLHGAVQKRELERPNAFAAERIEVLLETDLRLGEGAGLVGTENVHAAKIVHGCQAPHNDAFISHAQGAAGERHGYDHREQLGREPHRESDREEE
jgi:hypothetical protein